MAGPVGRTRQVRLSTPYIDRDLPPRPTLGFLRLNSCTGKPTLSPPIKNSASLRFENAVGLIFGGVAYGVPRGWGGSRQEVTPIFICLVVCATKMMPRANGHSNTSRMHTVIGQRRGGSDCRICRTRRRRLLRRLQLPRGGLWSAAPMGVALDAAPWNFTPHHGAFRNFPLQLQSGVMPGMRR